MWSLSLSLSGARLASLLMVSSAVLACGAEMPAAGGETFGKRDGWPADVAARTLGDGVVNRVPRVRVGDGGEVYVLRQEDPDFLNLDIRKSASFVTRHAADGRVLATIDGGGDLLVDFVVHPGGDLTTLAMRRVGDEERYEIVLARLAADGTRRFEQLLADDVSEHDRQQYMVTDAEVTSSTLPPWLEDGRIVINATLRFYYQSDYRLTMIDGVLYLAAPIFGLRIYRLSDALVPLWSTTILPVSNRWLFPTDPRLAADSDGTLWVTSGTDGDMVRVQEAHFATALDTHPTSGAILLSRVDAATGALRTMAVVDSPSLDDAIDLRVVDGLATIAGRSRVRKFDRPNDTLEWDLFVAHASATGMIDYRAIDVLREDLPYAAQILDDGRIAVVGTADFLQVDTNSVVENGAGMVVLLDRDGAPLHTSLLRGPRHVEVTACAASGDALYVGGRLDSYITHTCDGDRTGALCYNHAFFGRLAL